MTTGKDVTIETVLSRLRLDLGDGTFDVIDHWSADRCAIGIARPSDHRYLVYISTNPAHRESFSYQCERPSVASEAIYHAAAMKEDVEYDELIGAVRQHLMT